MLLINKNKLKERQNINLLQSLRRQVINKKIERRNNFLFRQKNIKENIEKNKTNEENKIKFENVKALTELKNAEGAEKYLQECKKMISDKRKNKEMFAKFNSSIMVNQSIRNEMSNELKNKIETLNVERPHFFKI